MPGQSNVSSVLVAVLAPHHSTIERRPRQVPVEGAGRLLIAGIAVVAEPLEADARLDDVLALGGLEPGVVCVEIRACVEILRRPAARLVIGVPVRELETGRDLRKRTRAGPR